MINVKMREEIEKRLDNLIEDAQNLVDNLKVKKNNKETVLWEKMEEAQMRNLLEMSLSVDSLKALEVFIQYQMGRNKIPKEFGNKIIEKINRELRENAEEISRKTGVKPKRVLLEIIRQYLGYLNRYFVYRAKMTMEGG